MLPNLRMPRITTYDLQENERRWFNEELERRKKQTVTTWLLWFFLGVFGAHRFYLGKIGTGIAMLFFGWLTLGIWWIVDAFLITGWLKKNEQEVTSQLLIEIEEMRKGPPPPPPTGTARLVLPDSSVITFPRDSSRWLGRADFAVALGDRSQYVSRQHLMLISEYGRYYVEDQNSTGGTLHNGVNIKGIGRRELRDGDSLTLAGQVNMVFRTT